MMNLEGRAHLNKPKVLKLTTSSINATRVVILRIKHPATIIAWLGPLRLALQRQCWEPVSPSQSC